MLKKEGFEALSVRYAGKYISPGFFARRMTGYSGFLGAAAGAVASLPFLKEKSFYCNPFDIMYVVARKAAV